MGIISRGESIEVKRVATQLYGPPSILKEITESVRGYFSK